MFLYVDIRNERHQRRWNYRCFCVAQRSGNDQKVEELNASFRGYARHALLARRQIFLAAKSLFCEVCLMIVT